MRSASTARLRALGAIALRRRRRAPIRVLRRSHSLNPTISPLFLLNGVGAIAIAAVLFVPAG